MRVLRDATTLANKITGLGSGLGEERLSDTESDTLSILDYNVRERIELFNTVSDQTTLAANVAGLVPIYKDMYEVPSITLKNGAIQPGEVIVGDAVLVKVEGSTFIETINDLYRIIEMEIKVDNDMDETISLKLVLWE